MLRIVKHAGIAVLLAAAGVAASSRDDKATNLVNPYHKIYEKNLAGMAKPDKTLDDVADPSSPVFDFSAELFSAQSKTCSQRCSTTCSRTCTTTRGCSTQCKVQTEGCGGTRTAPAPAPAGGTGTLMPVVPLAAALYPDPDPGFFTLGSTETQVRAAQGTPDSIALSGTLWFYGTDSVNFSESRVVGYSNNSRKLKVQLKPRVAAARTTFSYGAALDDVLAVQGTPTGISLNGHLWFYGTDSVTFRDGRVDGYSNTGRTLKVQ